VDVAAPVSARLRIAAPAVPAAVVLAGLVVGSWALRTLLAIAHDVPVYLPDEYVYAELARSIAETGRPLIRGELAHFPGLLQPLLAAPFWLTGDPDLAFRATQALHALAMSLAAVPAYLTARTLGLYQSVALGTAAVAVAAPGLVYSAYILSDPIGYVLVLAGLYAGVRALDRPSVRRELLFFALAGLATLTRVQYAFLLAAFLVGALVLERGGPRRLLVRFPVSAAVTAAGVAVIAVLGPSRLLGTYWTGTRDGVDVVGALAWLPVDGMLFAYAAGWVLVPGALIGLACALAAPRSRAEGAFAVLASGLVIGLFAVAAGVAELDARRFQERYLLALVPVAAIAFGLGWKRGRRARYASAALALALLFVAVRVPISGYLVYTAAGDSPTLWAIRRLAIAMRSATDGAVAVVIVATALSLAAVASALRRRSSGAGILALAGATLASLSLGAHSLDARMANMAVQAPEGTPRDWIDRADLGDVALLRPRISSRGGALAHLFWNRSVNDVLLLPGARPPDPFAVSHASPARDGRLLVDERAVRKALLVDTYGTAVDFTGAERVVTVPGFELWRPQGTPRLALLSEGYYSDGSLGRSGKIVAWPDGSGRTVGILRLVVTLPEGEAVTRLTFSGAGGRTRVTLLAGERRVIRIRIDAGGPAVVKFASDRYRFDGRRTTSVRALRPVFKRRSLAADIS
jgi:hypothetical protein